MALLTSAVTPSSDGPRIAASSDSTRTLQQIGDELGRQGIFTGGPAEYFEASGRLQAWMLIREGLYPWSKMVDIGCGCLRGGYWMIHFLDRGCWFGIEPNVGMVQTGLEKILEPEVRAAKCPTIDHNAVFETSVFGTKFDAFLCRSIWTHTAKWQIEQMLDNFLRDSTPTAFFLTSILPAFWPWQDYNGSEHRGRSHTSNTPAVVCHSLRWIRRACERRGLSIIKLPDGVMADQVWLSIRRKA